VQTLAESSFDAWTKLYKADENGPNAIISYYAKGALVALALDLIIRRDTAGARSLDDVMRALWERHGRACIGLEERGFEALAMAVTGLDLGDFFHQALDSTEDLDLASLLADLGIGLRLRAARHGKDFGGLAAGGAAASACGGLVVDGVAGRVKSHAMAQVESGKGLAVQSLPQAKAQEQAQVQAQALAEAPAPPTLGIRLRPEGTEPVIATVFTDSPAQAAGLAPGDTLVALDGLRISRDNLDKLLMAAGEGAAVEIHAFRRDELQVRRARLAPAPQDTCELWLLADAPAEAQARRAAWLGGQGGEASVPDAVKGDGLADGRRRTLKRAGGR
jgi:predicted metalloprotease with PDZ domain